MAFFELKTPRDMLEKARREHARLSTAFDIDNVFNFFVTVYHIQDYVRNTAAVPRPVVDAFLRDQDVKDSRDLCDKGKHLRLTKPGRIDPATAVRRRGALNSAPLNTLPLNSMEVKWLVYSGNREIDVQTLADRVLEKWDDFFVANGL